MTRGRIIWISVTDQLPAEGEEVLLSRDEVVSLAVFKGHAFALKEGTMVSDSDPTLKWTPVVPHRDNGPTGC